jgi:DNA polymerase-3 subunit gamma/tau
LTGNELEIPKPESNKKLKRVSDGFRTENNTPSKKIIIEKTPSVRDTLDKISTINSLDNGIQPKNKEIKDQSFNETTSNNSIDEVQFIEQFEVFIEKIKKKQPRLYSALLHKNIKLISDHQFSLVFQNQAIMEEFKRRIKPDMLDFLRKELKNQHIEIIESIADLDNMEKPTVYSDNEKLQKLAEKNPALTKLKNKFNLDFD